MILTLIAAAFLTLGSGATALSDFRLMTAVSSARLAIDISVRENISFLA